MSPAARSEASPAPTVPAGQPDKPADRTGRRNWARGPLLLLVLAAVAFAVHAPSLSNRSLNSDEAYAATQAQVLNRGGRLYVDTVDRKPPVVPYLYAATFRVTGSDDLLPLRVLAVIADVVTALLLAAEARRRFGRDRAGMIAGLLFLGGSAAFYATDFQTANFEVFMLPLMVAGFVLAARSRPVASGAAIGLATLTKQTGATTLLPAAWLLWRQTRGGADRPAGRLARLALGFVAPIAVAAIAFGVHDFFTWVFTGNGSYLDVGGTLGFTFHHGLTQTLWFVLANVALVGLAVLAARRWRRDVDLWLWVGAALVAVATGFRFFGHYYLQLLPPLSLLATGPLVRASWRALTAVAVVVAVPVAFFVEKTFATAPSHTDVVAADLAAYVRRTVAPNRRILVWGHLPEVYWRSGRQPATRFATTEFLTGQSGGRPPSLSGMQYAAPDAWADFDADLRAHPPALVLDLAPANIRNARYEAIPRFPQFRDYLDRHYRIIGHVDGVAAYAPR
jgi:hypothetical protein